MSTAVEKIRLARLQLHREFGHRPGSAEHIAALCVAAILGAAINDLEGSPQPQESAKGTEVKLCRS